MRLQCWDKHYTVAGRQMDPHPGLFSSNAILCSTWLKIATRRAAQQFSAAQLCTQTVLPGFLITCAACACALEPAGALFNNNVKNWCKSLPDDSWNREAERTILSVLLLGCRPVSGDHIHVCKKVHRKAELWIFQTLMYMYYIRASCLKIIWYY